MSNVNLILSELSKKQEDSITLPFSKKEVNVSKPKFKFQEEIVQLFESYDSEQSAILSYRKYINDYCSTIIGNDVNILDKSYFLYYLASKLSKGNKYQSINDNISNLDISSVFEIEEDDIKFKFIVDVPLISTENSFLRFFNAKKKLKVVEYAFCDIFRFVKTIIINNSESLTIDISDTDINSIYKIYTSLPVATCSSLIDYINNNISSKIKEAQKDNDIEQDPTIFVSI
tara:strand:- start:7637 stop:8326 length:690 start_codon:yes stop_codon:yes gene_type:complete